MTSFSPQPEFWIEDSPDGDWDDSGWNDGNRPGGPTPPEPPRRWLRWAALGAGLAVIAGLIAWQSRPGIAGDPVIDALQIPTTGVTSASSTQPEPTSEPPISSSESFETATGGGSDPNTLLPTTAGVVATGLTDPSLLKDATWELVGYGPDGVVRYTPATGQLVRTPVPGLNSGGPVSVVLTDDAVVIRPLDSVAGYLVRDGAAAEPLAGLLAGSGPALPGPDPDHVWVVQGAATGVAGVVVGDDRATVAPPGALSPAQLVLVDLAGTPTGETIDLPDIGGANPAYQLQPDGAGLALFQWVGGIYRLDADGPHVLTHGQVLATGPTTTVIYECDDTAHCAAHVIDRTTGQRRTLHPTMKSMLFLMGGITSPDGRWAAMLDPSSMSVNVIDLQTGATEASAVTINSMYYGGVPAMAFSPDGRYLLAAAETGVAVIDTASGRALGTLPVPQLTGLAVRPIG